MEDKVMRSMDNLRRIVIPQSLCQAFLWDEGTKLELERCVTSDTGEDAIMVRQAYPTCSLCRKETENLKAIEKGYICPACAKKV